MDSNFGMSLDELRRNIASAEVMAVWFPLLRKTLLVDTRHDATEPPMVRVVNTAQSMADRMRSLKKMRPRFPTPESVTLVPWPKYVRSLKESGVWEMLLARLAALGYPEAVRDCERAWAELARLEREEIEAAIRGAGYRTLWQRRT